MSGRLRIARARGAKRSSRSAAIGAVLSTSFCVPYQAGGRCTVKFSNVLDEKGFSVAVVVREVETPEVEEKLGKFMKENRCEGCIARGIALPLPALRKLVGEEFFCRVTTHSVPLKVRRKQGVAEQLNISTEELGRIVMGKKIARTLGKWSVIDFLRENLNARLGIRRNTTDASAEEISLARDGAPCDDEHCALSELQVYHLGALDLHRMTATEKVLEANRRLACDLNVQLRGDRIEERVWRVITETAPHLCLEAVMSKVRSVRDAKMLG